jgi:hypothetical protein
MSNRLIAFEATVQGKLDNITLEQRVAAETSMNIDFSEHFEYQNLQSRAFAMQVISHDEAQMVYAALGEVWSKSNGGWQSDVSLARKFTITKFLAEVAGQLIKKRKVR